MKQLLHINILVLAAIMLNSCIKLNTDRPSSGNYFLEISINGQSLGRVDEVYGFFLRNQDGCVSGKSYSTSNISQIDKPAYFIDVFIHHLENDSDFRGTATGGRTIHGYDGIFATNMCNMDLVVALEDKAFSTGNSDCELLSTGITNNITSINQVSQTVNGTKYDVEGNFTCRFRNPSNTILNVSGNYRTHFTTLR
jgi:hypothetical protein